jgi:hypothetical protein
MAYTVTASVITTQTFGVETLPQYIVFSAFTSSPVTASNTFTYTETGLSGLPCTAVFDGTTRIITIPNTCIVLASTLYDITITGTLVTGEFDTASFDILLVPMSYSAISSSIADHSFDVSTLPQDIIFTTFTSSPTYTSNTFTYTASGLPSCAIFDGTNLKITIPTTCATTLSTSYAVSITGTLVSGETSLSSFSLGLSVSHTITPSTISDKRIEMIDLPMNITFSSFTSSPSESSDTFTYTATGFPDCATFFGND